MITFRVLGSLDLRGPDGAEILSVLSQPKRTAILAYLAVASPRGFHRKDKVAGLFWPGSDQEHARNSLRGAVHHLRRSLGDAAILSRSDEEIGLGWEQVTCDAIEFQKALNAGDVGGALKTYTGDFLDGFFLSRCSDFEHWLEGERGRLRELAADASWEMAHQHLQAGRITDGERMGQRALGLNCTDENEARRFIATLVEVGDRAAAVCFYERFRKMLSEALELEPSPDTNALVERIRDSAFSEANDPGEPPLLPRLADSAVSSPLAADRIKTTEGMAAAVAPTPGLSTSRIRVSWGRRLAYGATVVLLLGAVIIMKTRGVFGGRGLAEEVVLVLPFSNETGDAQYESLGKVVAFRIVERLEREGMRVVPATAAMLSGQATLENTGSSPVYHPTAAIAAQFGAGTVVSGWVFPTPDSLRFEAEINKDGGARRVSTIPPVVVALNEVEEGSVLVGERVAGAVALYMDPGWGGFTPVMAPPANQAVVEGYIRAHEAFWWNLEEARREAERALELDPTYLPLKTFLAVIHLNLENYFAADSLLDKTEEFRDQMAREKYQWEWARATLDGDREAVYRSQEDALKRSSHPYNQWSLGVAALKMNRPRETLEVLSGMDPDSPLMRPVSKFWSDLGQALHMLEDHKRELREVLKGRDRHPDQPGVLRAEIRARAALGHIGEVRELVEEAIQKNLRPIRAVKAAAWELRYHGHREASRAIGGRGLAHLIERSAQVADTTAHRYELLQILYVLERWSEAEAIAEELDLEESSNLDYLCFLGTLAARGGEREKAHSISERIAAMEIPFDMGYSTRCRACIAAVLEEKENAVALLNVAQAQGWSFSVDVHADPDLESLRDYPPFKEFIRPKG